MHTGNTNGPVQVGRLTSPDQPSVFIVNSLGDGIQEERNLNQTLWMFRLIIRWPEQSSGRAIALPLALMAFPKMLKFFM